MNDGRPRASVVIPAHNEEAVIDRCLQVFAEAVPGEFDVVVVCNGCRDDTARIAARHAAVRVVEIPRASKVAALNAGDQHALTHPRVYLDADVEITLQSLRATVAALEAGAASAAPLPVLDTSGCGPGSRLYHRFRARLGYVRHSVLGAGVYGLSAAGRSRFGAFPDVIADDGFVYALFDPRERHNPPGATFTVRPPRTLRATYRRQTRIALGNLQLKAQGHVLATPGPNWRTVVRTRPRLVGEAAVYVGVNSVARLRAHSLLRAGGEPAWNRDETSRRSAAEGALP